jgi:hypothetical protein
MSSPKPNSKLNPKQPVQPLIKTPTIVVDPKIPSMRTKSGVPNGPTVGKVYKTY